MMDDEFDIIYAPQTSNKKYWRRVFIVTIIIIILCSIDLGDVDARPTPLLESCHGSLWSLQITITLTERALLILFAIQGWKFPGMGGRGLNPQP